MFASTVTAGRIVAVRPTLAPRRVIVRAEKQGDDFQKNMESAKSTSDPIDSLKKSVIGGQDQDAKQNVSATSAFAQDARQTLEPRVQDLRENQLTKGTTNKEEIFKFSGPLPELLNGRLAMLGFTACMAAEFATHQTLWQQIKDAPMAIALTFLTFFVASIIPIIRGNNYLPTDQDEGFGKSGFTVTNELINGRAAMLGFAIILGYELFANRPLFG